MKNKKQVYYELRLTLYITLFSILICVLFPVNNEIKKEEEKEIVADKEITEEPLIPEEEKDPIIEEKEEQIKGVAKISIPNTDFNEDVYQAKNNDYYLTHDRNGKYSRNGEIFLDYRVNLDKSKINLIYGHSAPYNLPSNIMENYYDKAYMLENPYIIIKTKKKEYKYQVFSVFVETEDWFYMDITFKNKKEYKKHLDKLKSKSIYDTGVEVNENDNIIIFQTCSTKKEYKKYDKKYALIVAKLVES